MYTALADMVVVIHLAFIVFVMFGGLTCLSRMFRNLPYICAVNPRLGHEYDPAYAVEPAVEPKKVVVIGGGPGCLECALAAAKRGQIHQCGLRSLTIGGGHCLVHYRARV